jgi:hypothetical protein
VNIKNQSKSLLNKTVIWGIAVKGLNQAMALLHIHNAKQNLTFLSKWPYPIHKLGFYIFFCCKRHESYTETF